MKRHFYNYNAKLLINGKEFVSTGGRMFPEWAIDALLDSVSKKMQSFLIHGTKREYCRAVWQEKGKRVAHGYIGHSEWEIVIDEEGRE